MEESERKNLYDFRKVLKKRKPTFVRKDSFKMSKLGKQRKKKQKWRRPRGRHSKLREKRTGHMIQPSIGWSSPRAVRGLTGEAKPKLIFNVADMDDLKANEIAIMGKVGKKKRIEIAEKAVAENKLILNVDVKKFLEQIKKEKAAKEEAKKKLEQEKAKQGAKPKAETKEEKKSVEAEK